jgi:hypothetical protein
MVFLGFLGFGASFPGPRDSGLSLLHEVRVRWRIGIVHGGDFTHEHAASSPGEPGMCLGLGGAGSKHSEDHRCILVRDGRDRQGKGEARPARLDEGDCLNVMTSTS